MGSNLININTETFASKFAQLTPEKQERFSAIIEGFLLAMSCISGSEVEKSGKEEQDVNI